MILLFSTKKVFTMKKRNLNKLSLKKATLNNLLPQVTRQVQGGGTKLCTKFTCDYSQCGTGPATIGGPACCPDTSLC
jgi:hypothetical protein